MKTIRFILGAVIALILGFGMGLTYAWVISPVKYVEAAPQALRVDFKDHFRSAISAAYASTGDLERARARLDLLNDPDPAQALIAQAQRMLASGASPESVQQVALLGSALEGQVAVVNTPTPQIPTSTTGEVEPPDITVTNTPEENLVATEPEATNTPIPEVTATPRPTLAPTATLGAPYQLVGQDTICEPDLVEGLLQIYVSDKARKPIPGAEIIITWSNGEEHIFTGLKPEISHGYADYLMSDEISYSVRMADGGTPATDLNIPTCTDTEGEAYPGGLRLTFQQP